MLGRFQDPTSRRLARPLKMPEKPRQESVTLVVAGRVEPGAIGRCVIDIPIARASEDLARELDALLRRVGLERMQAADPRRQTREEPKLQLDLPPPGAEPGCAVRRVRGDRLPNAR